MRVQLHWPCSPSWEQVLRLPQRNTQGSQAMRTSIAWKHTTAPGFGARAMRAVRSPPILMGEPSANGSALLSRLRAT